MELSFIDRLRHSWDVFRNREPTVYQTTTLGPGYSTRPDRSRFTKGNERTIVTSIYNRIALDVAKVNIEHCKVDENDRYLGSIDSSLNSCLNLEANIDQTGRAFIQDVVMSMFDEGCVAIVPVETTVDPKTGSYKIHSMRTGKILEWYPKHVKVRVYDENTGTKKDVLLEKKYVAIIENPLYAVINEPNSTMQRLIKKLSLLDAVDEQASSGKLDMIIQLPYVVKTDLQKQRAEERRKNIMDQIKGPLGIAYTDGTEKIIQLNRPLENNLLKQIEYLTNMLWGQLGITQGIMDGTADEKTMLNYNARTIEPIVSAIVDEMKRKFLTKTARSQKQTIKFFTDPFSLVPVTEIAKIADIVARNEIMTSNEIRQEMGMKPADDPKADELRNSNMPHPEETGGPAVDMSPTEGDPNGMAPMNEEAAERTQTGKIEADTPISELPDYTP